MSTYNNSYLANQTDSLANKSALANIFWRRRTVRRRAFKREQMESYQAKKHYRRERGA